MHGCACECLCVHVHVLVNVRASMRVHVRMSLLVCARMCECMQVTAWVPECMSAMVTSAVCRRDLPPGPDLQQDTRQGGHFAIPVTSARTTLGCSLGRLLYPISWLVEVCYWYLPEAATRVSPARRRLSLSRTCQSQLQFGRGQLRALTELNVSSLRSVL